MTDPKESKKPRPSSRINNYARFTGIGFQMVAIIGIGAYGGVKLDERYPNEYSLWTIICSLAAIGIAMYFVIKQVTNFSNRNND
ncbi:putative F0F1-ATPase subunit (Ca2+/Mg2+ transporter) [Ulvibacter sp. MAR_2010_11]|uniref:AtpZ/AtpI family protein n=1 Tax=Ulvibacter sp. MAR_2010_11 TaxID=1250229 RepID=UPI000CBFDF29|nr:AtpZ/AtpI family protein [Ulvibacter sp. MAR_2010_11]PKA82897.1 putative F0F1-ATPase subunit (Ca2+/Mg2+ transporter) [Ulvibacter sp. MAR_2010_11]